MHLVYENKEGACKFEERERMNTRERMLQIQGEGAQPSEKGPRVVYRMRNRN